MKLRPALRSSGYAALAALFGAQITSRIERRLTGHNAVRRRATFPVLSPGTHQHQLDGTLGNATVVIRGLVHRGGDHYRRDQGAG